MFAFDIIHICHQVLHIMIITLQNKIIFLNSYSTISKSKIKFWYCQAYDDRSRKENKMDSINYKNAAYLVRWKHIYFIIRINLKGIKSGIRWSRINSYTFISSIKTLCVRFHMIYLYSGCIQYSTAWSIEHTKIASQLNLLRIMYLIGK